MGTEEEASGSAAEEEVSGAARSVSPASCPGASPSRLQLLPRS